MVRRGVVLVALVVLAASWMAAPSLRGLARAQTSKPAAASNVAGMYTFLREGEFVQLTVDDGQLSGYISRFGDGDSDKGQFIDQFFDKASLEGDHITFNTRKVHAVWYEFDGVFSEVPGKAGKESTRVLKGKLVQHASDSGGADKARQRDVEFKSFPGKLGR